MIRQTSNATKRNTWGPTQEIHIICFVCSRDHRRSRQVVRLRGRGWGGIESKSNKACGEQRILSQSTGWLDIIKSMVHCPYNENFIVPEDRIQRRSLLWSESALLRDKWTERRRYSEHTGYDYKAGILFGRSNIVSYSHPINNDLKLTPLRVWPHSIEFRQMSQRWFCNRITGELCVNNPPSIVDEAKKCPHDSVHRKMKTTRATKLKAGQSQQHRQRFRSDKQPHYGSEIQSIVVAVVFLFTSFPSNV